MLASVVTTRVHILSILDLGTEKRRYNGRKANHRQGSTPGLMVLLERRTRLNGQFGHGDFMPLEGCICDGRY